MTKKIRDSLTTSKAKELCESRGGRPGFPVPDNPYSVCGRKATMNLTTSSVYAGIGYYGSNQLTNSC